MRIERVRLACQHDDCQADLVVTVEIMPYRPASLSGPAEHPELFIRAVEPVYGQSCSHTDLLLEDEGFVERVEWELEVIARDRVHRDDE